MHNFSENPSLLERLIGAATYLSGGLVGVVWFILSFLLKLRVSSFLQYHISQSVIFFLGLYIISLFFSIIIGFLVHIPYLDNLVKAILTFFNTPIHYGFSIIGALISIIVVYMALGALLGKYSYFPFISEALNARRR